MASCFVYLDTGISVEAETEEEAIKLAKEILLEMLQEDDPDLCFLVELEEEE